MAQPGLPSYGEIVKLWKEDELYDKLFIFFPDSNDGERK